MKQKFLILSCFFTLVAGCSSHVTTSDNLPVGEVVSNVDEQTFHAQYKGRNLKVGDHVTILKYEDFESDLKDHQSRVLPLRKKKTVIGAGVISSVLNDNYYEFKSDKPQHIPEGAFIEKL
ncbi:MAG: hypothetical protein H7281_18690 [Bacteriovorax sp.]|nr:hypothetical protein [Bacteriovorax sp.]